MTIKFKKWKIMEKLVSNDNNRNKANAYEIVKLFLSYDCTPIIIFLKNIK